MMYVMFTFRILLHEPHQMFHIHFIGWIVLMRTFKVWPGTPDLISWFIRFIVEC